MMESDTVIRAYKAMKSSQLRHLLLVEYRCAKGCLLLHVWNTATGGAMYYRPPVRISQPMHERTGVVERGRVPERGGAVADLDAGRWVWITDEQERNGVGVNWLLIGCSHCVGLRFPAATIKADVDAATPGKPVKVADFWMTPEPPK
ncbi:hypothetical protein [Mycobacterium ostraviense]|uniref:hypothetical protein n=1 Tax=Mycobacterium ostraviense TaxID=2738409 RepID=UPI001156BE7D|nr:hypothetical protein [Mycobacterium ostraviense]